jgi:flagellar hook assembly protein FlgD
MAQMAQFEALNQMKTVADSMKVLQGVQELNSAASMIGKTITGQQVDAIAVTRDLVGRDLYGRPFAKLTSLERAEVNKDDRVVTDEKGIPMLLVGSKVVDLFTISEVQ